MSSPGWRPALRSTGEHPNGHSRLAANWTDPHGNYKVTKKVEFSKSTRRSIVYQTSFRRYGDIEQTTSIIRIIFVRCLNEFLWTLELFCWLCKRNTSFGFGVRIPSGRLEMVSIPDFCFFSFEGTVFSDLLLGEWCLTGQLAYLTQNG